MKMLMFDFRDTEKEFFQNNELVDFEAEKARLEKELEAAKKDLEFVENKLNNPGFMAKAPEKVVAQQRDAQAKHAAKIAMLQESISKLK